MSIFDRPGLDSGVSQFLPSFGANWGQGQLGNLGNAGLDLSVPLDATQAFNPALTLAPSAIPSFGGEAAGAGGGTGMFGGLFDNFLTSKDANGITTQGWGGPALGAASGLLQGFMGMKQYGLAKQGLEDQRRQFDLNYQAQKTTTNTALEDRQRARVASNSGAYESVGSYLDRNGIK